MTKLIVVEAELAKRFHRKRCVYTVKQVWTDHEVKITDFFNTYYHSTVYVAYLPCQGSPPVLFVEIFCLFFFSADFVFCLHFTCGIWILLPRKLEISRVLLLPPPYLACRIWFGMWKMIGNWIPRCVLSY